MRIKFENVGARRKTWIAEYPITAPLKNVAEDDKWWCNQLRAAVRSDPDWGYDETDGKVYILAGWRVVGCAYVVEEETDGNH